MSNEYIRLSEDEITYAKKNLLTTEFESLKTLKNLQNYKELRNSELLLKISLKTSLDSLQQQLALLDKLLPHSSWKKPKEQEDEEEMLPSIHTVEYSDSPDAKKSEREKKKKEKQDSI